MNPHSQLYIASNTVREVIPQGDIAVGILAALALIWMILS